jgi:hypothetical protein
MLKRELQTRLASSRISPAKLARVKSCAVEGRDAKSVSHFQKNKQGKMIQKNIFFNDNKIVAKIFNNFNRCTTDIEKYEQK